MPPTRPQLRLAARLGIPLHRDVTRGELSELIAERLGRQRQRWHAYGTIIVGVVIFIVGVLVEVVMGWVRL